MSEAAQGPGPRPTCPRCLRPVKVCYCAKLPQLLTRTRVVLFQHPRESGVAIGTARMASLCLPQARLHVGVRFAGTPALADALTDPLRPPVLLYPGDGARDVAHRPPAGPVTLCVLDGTWWQARKLLRQNPELAALPRYTFVPEVPSQYRIRKEPAANCVSTIEALMYTLGALEGERERFAALLSPFHAMIDAQLAHEASSRTPRARKRRRRAAAGG